MTKHKLAAECCHYSLLCSNPWYVGVLLPELYFASYLVSAPSVHPLVMAPAETALTPLSDALRLRGSSEQLLSGLRIASSASLKGTVTGATSLRGAKTLSDGARRAIYISNVEVMWGVDMMGDRATLTLDADLQATPAHPSEERESGARTKKRAGTSRFVPKGWSGRSRKAKVDIMEKLVIVDKWESRYRTK